MPKTSRIWKTKELKYEGYPLFLRYTDLIPLNDYKALYPELAVITHQLAKVKPNGLPDPDYNDSLFQFDSDIRSAFEASDLGVAVLIETSAGKRRYYIYIATEADVNDTLSDVLRKNPEEQLAWIVRPDPEWAFIQKYSQQFLDGNIV